MRGVWGVILLTIIAVYIISFLIIKLPFLEIKEYSVIGIRQDEKQVLQNYFIALGRKIVFLPDKIIFSELNKKFGNRFKDINVDRDFTTEGIVINLTFQRRTPVAKVKVGKNIYLIDREGVIFKDNIPSNLPIIRAKDINELKSVGRKISKIATLVDNITILSDKVIVQKDKIKYILPNIKLIREKELKVLKYALRQNFNAKVIDLRYKKFILLR